VAAKNLRSFVAALLGITALLSLLPVLTK